MAKRKTQFRKQQIATVGDHSSNSLRRLQRLARKIELARARELASQVN